jgi:hypothetical protein
VFISPAGARQTDQISTAWASSATTGGAASPTASPAADTEHATASVAQQAMTAANTRGRTKTLITWVSSLDRPVRLREGRRPGDPARSTRDVAFPIGPRPSGPERRRVLERRASWRPDPLPTAVDRGPICHLRRTNGLSQVQSFT